MFRGKMHHRIDGWALPCVVFLSLVSLGSAGLGGPERVVDPVAIRAPAPPPEAQEAVDPLATPEPERWAPAKPRCRRYRDRRYCNGPRRVPMPEGEAAERAGRLGLGTREAANVLMTRPPREGWVDAARALDGESDEGSLLWPVPEGRYGRGFGYIRHKDGLEAVRHDGVDIIAEPGTEVRAVAGGVVAYADNGVSGYGNLVLVVHPDGSTSLYAHLKAAYLFAGERVRRGQVLGEVGTTGLSRGPHLHFEYREGGRPTNPARRFVGRPGGPNS